MSRQNSRSPLNLADVKFSPSVRPPISFPPLPTRSYVAPERVPDLLPLPSLNDSDEGLVPDEVMVTPSSVYTTLYSRSFQVFMIVTIIVIAIVFYIGMRGKNMHWFNHLHMMEWGRNTSVLAVIFVIGVVLFSWACYSAYSTTLDSNTRNMIMAGYILNMIALIVITVSVFKQDDHSHNSTDGLTTAYWVALFAIVVTIAMFWPMASNKMACGAMVPYLIWLCVSAYLFRDMSNRNGHSHNSDSASTSSSSSA
jgi:tryptophan-rich sensory protein